MKQILTIVPLLAGIIWAAYPAMATAENGLPSQPSSVRDIKVNDAQGIRNAMKTAQAGDIISIQPGEYNMGEALVTGNSGSKDMPIILQTSGGHGYARLEITGSTDVGFRILSRFWVLRGLDIEGNPKATLDLIQIDATRGGGDLQMVDCRISRCREYLFKASRNRENAADNVILDHCEWFDCPETAIDLVAGDNWIIRGNYVHDYGKDGAAHYGIFLKGGGKNGLIEGNIVDGKGGKSTVGISFGGGLTGAKWLPLIEGGKLAPEHLDGICRNNIVVRTGDCAYHANNGSDCKFYNNLAYNCRAGFQRQASYPPDPTLINNIFSGGIRGAGESVNNLTNVETAWFVAADKNDFRLTATGKAALAGKGQALTDNPADFFGQPRKLNDLGPVNADAQESTVWVDRRMGGQATPPFSRPVSQTTVDVPAAATLEKVKNAPANTWIEVPNSALLAVAPKHDQFPKTWGVCGPPSVVSAWCGAAFDTKRNRLIVWGGGHADYHGNELYAFDINKMAWERLTDPFPDPVNDQEVNADGSPNSRHTYGGLAYLAHVDRFFGLGGSLAGVGFAKCERTWVYDFDAKKWEDRRPGGQLPGGGFCLGCAYDPNSKRLFLGSTHRGLYAYEYEKNIWTNLDSQPADGQGLAVDTKRKLLVGLGHGHMSLYDIGNENFKQQTINAPGGEDVVNAENAAGWDYDPVADRMIAWTALAPANVYAFDLAARKWDLKQTDGGPKMPTAARNGVFGRWRYVAGVNAFIVVPDAGGNVFFYKNTKGMGQVP